MHYSLLGLLGDMLNTSRIAIESPHIYGSNRNCGTNTMVRLSWRTTHFWRLQEVVRECVVWGGVPVSLFLLEKGRRRVKHRKIGVYIQNHTWLKSIIGGPAQLDLW